MPLLRRRSSADGERRIPRKDRRGASPVVVALIALALVAVGTYLGFTKDIPFTKGYRVSAVFESATSIRPNSPVRVAGVNVGKVKKISRYQDTDLALIEMEITDAGLPIHKDATLKIRPRIFLEGNFYVDLSPGTPGSPALDDGDTIRVTQTSTPVQFYDVLTALQSDTRADLQTLLDEYGRALDGDPAESDGDGSPLTRGETAGESLNDTLDDAPDALRGVSIVNEALLGTEPRDLSRAIAGLQRVTAALGRNESTLQDWVEGFNATLSIFADEKENVGATLRELERTIPVADRTLAALNRSFPSVRAFSREILPGVRETPATIEASFPWIEQMRGLLRPSELRGLARELAPASEDLAVAADAAISLFPNQERFARCLTEVILPTGDVVIREPEGRKQFETGVENYKEFWYTMVALSGEGQNFDGNGQYVRFQPGGGTRTITSGVSNLGRDPQFSNPAAPPIGTRPIFPGRRPPYRPDVPCHTNQLPDLNAAPVGPPDGGGTGGGGDQGGAGGGAGGGQQTLPGVTLPELPLPRAGRESVARALASRLNPFRATTSKRAKRRTARGAGR
ncbi:MAG TPA: MlaD family protein [Solirubrobacteraceae bacterium]|jgi:virulence factor Mce-like protein|nr:MlaD family protein [Solirubrobacteraceae bacterium]